MLGATLKAVVEVTLCGRRPGTRLPAITMDGLMSAFSWGTSTIRVLDGAARS